MGMSSGRAACCSGQSRSPQPPASQRGQTATRAASCTYGQLPFARPSQRPDLHRALGLSSLAAGKHGCFLRSLSTCQCAGQTVLPCRPIPASQSLHFRDCGPVTTSISSTLG